MSYLSKGSQGEQVKKMQTALNRAECTCSVDGVFGDETEQALIGFQIGHMLHVDGVCGPETWKALETYLADYTELRKAVEECLEVVEKLPEYKKLEALLYG